MNHGYPKACRLEFMKGVIFLTQTDGAENDRLQNFTSSKNMTPLTGAAQKTVPTSP